MEEQRRYVAVQSASIKKREFERPRHRRGGIFEGIMEKEYIAACTGFIWLGIESMDMVLNVLFRQKLEVSELAEDDGRQCAMKL